MFDQALLAILRAAPVGVFITDNQAHCSFVNQSWCELAGLDSAKALNQGWLQALHPDDRAQVQRLWLDAGNNAGSLNLEFRFSNLISGETRWVLCKSKPLPTEMLSESPGFIATVTDITLLKQSQEALANANTFLDSIIENIPNMIFIKEAENLSFVRFNKAGEDLLGVTRSALLGKNDYDFFPPDQAEFFIGKDRAVLDSGTLHLIPEEPIDTPSNGRRFLRTRKIPLGAPHSEHRFLLGISEDITDQKLAAEEMHRAKVAAESAARLKSLFLANMSHEIRTPMNAVIGMTDLLQHSPLDDGQREYVDTIATASKTLLEIIDGILDYSRLEAGKLELSTISFSPAQLVKTVERSIASRCMQSQIDFVSTIADSTPNLLIGDDLRIRQIITNLLSNAFKFTPRGGRVELEMNYTSYNEFEGIFEFSVTDSGIGIPIDKQSVIFESFTQADASITRQYGGTGLGLSIVKQLLTLMAGSIELFSEVGKGSKFICRLPLKSAHTDKNCAPTSSDSMQTLAGVKILLVEDNPVNQRLAKLVLEKAGCQVALADNGELAVRLRADENFQVVLMDIQMPLMDGLTATKAIRDWEQRNRTSAVPIMAMTAHAMQGDRERFLESGMDDYISKPFNRDTLIQKIGDLITATDSRRSKITVD